MTSGVLRHPFQVGEQYRNEDGAYTVVRIDEPNIVIQYEDGRSLESSIKLQARIWERIQDEAATAAIKAKSSPTVRRNVSSRSRASWGRAFHGLQDTDFSLDLSGTKWRRREELGGLLAVYLAEKSNEVFDSHAVPRRPQVHVADPDHYSRKTALKVAKFLFDLSPEGAFYGLYIEKSNEPMDDDWDWRFFVDAFAQNADLRASILVSMTEYNLQWTVNLDQPGGALNRYIAAENDELMMREGDEPNWSPFDWDGFIEMLREIPADQWCNLYLAATLDKTKAIELEVQVADKAATVFDALLPLYHASVQRG